MTATNDTSNDGIDINKIILAIITAIVSITVGYWQFALPPSDGNLDEQNIEYVGRVIDANTQKPISGAKITLEFKGAPPITYTDSEGVYRFTANLKTGEALGKVRVEAKGYNSYNRNITLLTDNYSMEQIEMTLLVPTPTKIPTKESLPTVTPEPKPTSLPTPTPKPADLIVKGLRLSPSSPRKGENVIVTAQVCNEGEQTATGITVNLKLDRSDSDYDSLSISELNDGQCKDIPFSSSYSQTGQFNTEVNISSNHSKDSNPDNNQRSQMVSVSPRLAKITITIEKIELIIVHDDNNWPKKDILEMFMHIKVNGRTARWPNDGGHRGMGKGHVNLIDQKFNFQLEDDQPLNIYFEAWDADDNPDDLMGRISEEYDLSGGNWTGGTYTKRGSQPGNGSYEVTYTIKVDWS